MIESMEKLRSQAAQNQARLKEHKSKIKEQEEQCQYLRTRLQVLRLSRQEKARLEAKAKEEEKLRLERTRQRRQRKFRLRQKDQWSQIRSYRRNQEEIKAERRFQLHQELKSVVKQRRQRALQDFIRVNLRLLFSMARFLNFI